MKHGPLFGEHIKTEKVKRRTYDDTPRSFTTRDFLLPSILVIVVVILVIKLFALQIVEGAKYRQLSDSNRIRTQIIHAPRGVIFDRNGIPLVLNLPGFRRIVADDKKNDPAKKSFKTEVITKEDALPLIAKGAQNIEVDSLREYPYQESLGHVIGYIGQISQEEYKEKKSSEYQPTDWLGKSGVERSYEQMLRGKDGQQLIEVDAFGNKIRSLGETDPLPGLDVTLTIDAKLQKAIYEASKDIQKGAIVVSRPDGEILALISRPSFDPNLFTRDKTYKTATDSAYTSWKAVISDNDKQPLLDRAIGGTYPPGSTFKLLTAVSGLENHVIDKGYSITDTGVLKVGEFSYANWYYTDHGKKEEGQVDVVKAIARSNDIFFYKLAEKVGADKLSATAGSFGVGYLTGIDIGGEAAGLLPTKDWKEKEVGEKWYLGDSFHFGIGQGYLLTTPLQVNSWTATIANGGTFYQPRLLKSKDPKINKQGLVSEKTLALIRQGMIASCSPGGVAFPIYDFKVKNAKLKVDGKNYLKVASASADMRQVSVACKTGTAQHGGEKTLPHAWITLFAPAYKPEIVVTVLNESSGEGSQQAAPIAKKVLDAYFEKK